MSSFTVESPYLPYRNTLRTTKNNPTTIKQSRRWRVTFWFCELFRSALVTDVSSLTVQTGHFFLFQIWIIIETWEHFLQSKYLILSQVPTVLYEGDGVWRLTHSRGRGLLRWVLWGGAVLCFSTTNSFTSQM